MKIFPIFKKEVRIGFASPMVYVLWSVFLFIAGIMFVAITGHAAAEGMQMFGGGGSVMDTIFRPLYHNLSVILLFITPGITMRVFSEEKRAGTLELLFTYPLTDFDIVFGKYIAMMSLLAFLLVPTVLYPYFIHGVSPIDWGAIGAEYLGLLLLGGCYLAVGVWASALFDSQITAAVLTFGVLLGFWLIGWFTDTFTISNVGFILGQISILNHFDSFSKGVINTADLSFYLFFIATFLYLTLKNLESRSWRGAAQ